MKDKISIIIPVYNGGKTIARCLSSLVNQKSSSADYEIIVINDGSTDNTDKILKKFASEYSNIKYCKKENGGVSSARNTGLSMADGNYITFVDCDDTVNRNYINILEQNTGHDITVFAHLVNGRIGIFQKSEIMKFRCGDNPSIADMYKNDVFNTLVNKLYKKNVCCKFDEKMVLGEDLLFNVHAFSKAEDIVYKNCFIYMYYMNNGSAMHRYRPEYFNDYVALFPVMKKFAEEKNISNEFLMHRYACCINHFILVLANDKTADYNKEIRKIWNLLDNNNMLDIETKNKRFLLFRYRCFFILELMCITAGNIKKYLDKKSEK